jgi:hypothetical protein
MKKVAFILAGLLVIMLAGCGEGSSSAGGSSVNDVVDTVEKGVDSVANAAVTTPKTPHNLSSALGTPPGLPE